MRILLVIENLKSGGKQRRIIELIKGFLLKGDIDFKLLVLSEDIYYENIYRLDFNCTILKKKWKKDPFLFFKIFREYKNYKPHIIHTWGSMSSIYCLPLKIFTKIKLINGMIVHANKQNIFTEDGFRSFITFPFSDCIVANSKAGLEAFNVNKKKGVVIYNGFDYNRIKELKPKSVMIKKFGIQTNFIIGMVAAFEQRKNFKLFIDAAKSIIDKYDDITFLAVGGGILLNEIKESVSEKYQERIIFTDKQNDIESIVNILDIGVLLSIHMEGISNSIMEYMALGKPVIATNNGGTREIISNNETGYLIGPLDFNRLVEKIEFLFKNDDLRKKMGDNGLKRLKQYFNHEKMANEYIALYKTLI